jgi:hypothetical protein
MANRARTNETPVTQLEIICLDQHGVSPFNLLLERRKEAVFYAGLKSDVSGHKGIKLP